MDAVLIQEDVRDVVAQADIRLAREVADFYTTLRDLGVTEPDLSISTGWYLDRALAAQQDGERIWDDEG